jgi:hypothetical protein
LLVAFFPAALEGRYGRQLVYMVQAEYYVLNWQQVYPLVANAFFAMLEGC